MPVKGRLSEMDLPSLIQFTCNEGSQAQLRVQQNGQEALVYFDGGDVVHAKLGDEVGEDVIYRLLGWQDGQFTLEVDVPPPSQTIETPWSALLLDGLRRRDEEMWDGEEEDVLAEGDLVMEESEEGESMGQVRALLADLCDEVPGFLSAMVGEIDGEGVAKQVTSSLDMEDVNPQLTLMIEKIEAATERLQVGVVEDYLLTTDQSYLLVRLLGEGQFFLGIVVDKEASNLGNVRLNSRVCAERLTQALCD